MEIHTDCLNMEVKEEPMEDQACSILQLSSQHTSRVDSFREASENNYVVEGLHGEPLKVKVEEELMENQVSHTLIGSSQQASVMDSVRGCTEEVFHCDVAEVKKEDVSVKDEPLENQDDLSSSTTTFYPEIRSISRGTSRAKKQHSHFIRQRYATGGGPPPPSPPKEDILAVALDRAMKLDFAPAMNQVDSYPVPDCKVLLSRKDGLTSTHMSGSSHHHEPSTSGWYLEPASTVSCVNFGIHEGSIIELNSSDSDLDDVRPLPGTESTAASAPQPGATPAQQPTARPGRSGVPSTDLTKANRKRARQPSCSTPRRTKRRQAATLKEESYLHIVEVMLRLEATCIAKQESLLQSIQSHMEDIKPVMQDLKTFLQGAQAFLTKANATYATLQSAGAAVIRFLDFS